jgi:hypothetical protein
VGSKVYIRDGSNLERCVLLFFSTNFRGIGGVAATLLCAGLASFQGGAEEPFEPSYIDPVLEPWRWQSFPELKGTGLRCLTEAADGAMWFGTNEGGAPVRWAGMEDLHPCRWTYRRTRESSLCGE